MNKNAYVKTNWPKSKSHHRFSCFAKPHATQQRQRFKREREDRELRIHCVCGLV